MSRILGWTIDQAERLRVTSATPSEVYVILRISGLDALEDGAAHQPQWRAYLDPHTRREEGLLTFAVPTYTVIATRWAVLIKRRSERTHLLGII